MSLPPYAAEVDAAARMIREGRPLDAAAKLAPLAAQHPSDEILLSLHATALMRGGELQAALTAFERAVSHHPRSRDAAADLGFAAMQAGVPDKAIEAFERAVGLDRSFYPGWCFLARLHLETDDMDRAFAAYRAALNTDPFVKDGTAIEAAMKAERYGEAERIARTLLSRQPGYPPAARTLATLAGQVGAIEEAPKILGYAVPLYPADMPLRRAFIVSLEEAGDYKGAIAEAEMLTRLMPGDVGSHLTLGRVHGHAGQYEASLAAYDAALTLAGDGEERGHIALLRGHILKILGQRDEAIAAYRESASIVPGNGAAWWALADMKTYRFSADDRRQMETLAQDAALKGEQRSQAAYGLGKAFENDGDHKAAFHWYSEGARLRPDIRFDVAENDAVIDNLVSAFKGDNLKVTAPADPALPRPIFIVGLPRSGSTLIEQILASHSQIEGTMELPTLPQIERRMRIAAGQKEGGEWPANIGALTADELAAFGRAYIEETALFRTGKPYFIDKLPPNFERVGLIHKILPGAIVIDARRHPMDTGYSAFKQHFAGGHEWSYDLAHIGAHYNAYLRLMDHWAEALPGRVLTVQYEEMVADTEATIRAVLDHVGVAFEPACLEFHKNDRAVRTASSEQVRQPIYRKSVAVWQQVEAELKPLADALGVATLARFQGFIPKL